MPFQVRGVRAPIILPDQPAVPAEVQPPKLVRPPTRGRWWLAAALLALLTGFVFHRLVVRTPGGRAKPAAAVLRTARVRTGVLEHSIRVSGVTAAGRYAFLETPRLPGSRGGGHDDFMLVLEKLVPPGSRVKKGQVVAEFDRQYMLVRLEEYQASVFQHEVNLVRLRAQLDWKRKAHQQKIQAAQGRMDKAALDLKTAPVRSLIQTERFKLGLGEAQAYYAQLVKEASYLEISERAQIRGSELGLQVSRLEQRRAEANSQRMVVRAPIDGLTVMQTITRSGELGQIQPGDQLHPGQGFMQIVDLRSMVVDAGVNQVDAEKLRVGALARVRFDAYPDLVLPARVHSIGTLAKARGFRGSFVKEIPIRLKLEKSDARVVPNFSVSAELILDRAPQATLVPLECVFYEKPGRQPFAFVQTPSGWEQRELELGLANNTVVAVRSGLRDAEVVAAQRPPGEKARAE